MPNSSKANIYNDVTINTNSRKSNYRRRDIILSNKVPILKMLDKFEKDLDGLKNAIKNNDKEKLFNIFNKTRDIRKRIIDEGQDVKEPNFGRKN